MNLEERRTERVHTSAFDGLATRERFADAYREHREFVYNVVRRMGMPACDAEDVVQDVFVVLHARLPDLHARASLRGWLRSVAVYVCSNKRRSLSLVRRRLGTSDAPVDPDALCDGTQRTADQSVADQEQRRALCEALARLDPQKRQVLVMTALEDRTAAEIASLTRTSPNTVSSRLRAARQHVGASLGKAPLVVRERQAQRSA